jgi:signal transduction histidine kinase/GAF domain-containing protein
VTRNGIQERDLAISLLDLVQNASVAADFDAALAALLAKAVDLVPCDGFAVMWLRAGHLEVMAGNGPTAPLRGLTLPVNQMGAAQPAVDSGRRVLVSDTAGDTRWQRVPGEEAVRSWLGVPLLLENRTIGLLEWTARAPGHFDAQDVDMAVEVARRVAPILHRDRLLDDTRHRLRELVETLPASTPSEPNLSAELEQVVREAQEYTTAQQAFVFVHDEESQVMRCVAASGEREDQLREAMLHGDGTLDGWRVAAASGPAWLGTSPSDRDRMAALGIENTLILPLRVAGEPVGMLGLAASGRDRRFGRDSIRTITQLASQASLILERAYQAGSEPAECDYEMVMLSSPLGVAVLTLTGDIRAWNPALSGLLSRSGPHLVDHSLSEFLLPDDAPSLTQAIEEVSITGQRQQVEARIETAPEDLRHVRISLALGGVADRTGGSLVAMMEDITSIKILERERVEYLGELREQHEKLQELDRLKSRFVSNVSHELRTPLAVIKLFAALARKGRPEKQSHYLQTIEKETHRLETMVENILDLSRMDRNGLHVQPERLAAEEIIAQVLDVYSETAKQKAITLRNRTPSSLPPLWADKNHLIQVLTNLVDNALKYTPLHGSVWIAARECDSDPQRMLEIAVGDTGVGIPPDEQQRIFERFYRGSNNIPDSTGTGLGLAIVKELMAQHHGSVTVDSTVGRGTVFLLRFPLHDGSEPPDLSGESRSQPLRTVTNAMPRSG